MLNSIICKIYQDITLCLKNRINAVATVVTTRQIMTKCPPEDVQLMSLVQRLSLRHGYKIKVFFYVQLFIPFSFHRF